jgi:hypothetical protein
MTMLMNAGWNICRCSKRSICLCQCARIATTAHVKRSTIDGARIRLHARGTQDYEQETYTSKQLFHSLFGTSPEICAKLWTMLSTEANMDIDRLACPKHLLWGLMLLKIYATEPILSSLAGGCDVQTFRKWTWQFVAAIAALADDVVQNKLVTAHEQCLYTYLTLLLVCVYRLFGRTVSSIPPPTTAS